MRRLLATAILLAPAAASAAETIYVDDPLTSTPKGAVAGVVAGVKGGSFGASGWTTTGDEDAIWFLIPATLPKARIEVSVTGISNASLDGEEHDLIVTYGDNDRTEPVDYAPAYRNNNFKTNLRIFGATSPAAGGRPQGSNKLELRLCPAGFPGYSDSCPPGCTDLFEVAYLGGPPEAIPWDGTKTYRLSIAWSPGVITYGRGGPEAPVSIKYPGTLAPKELRVRIGSPRHGVGSPNHMPKGLVFKNLLIAGETGSPTPVCGSTVPDAGVDAATDAGACDPAKPMRVLPLEVVGTGDAQVHRVTYEHCGGAPSFRVLQFFVADAVETSIPHLAGGYEGGKLYLDAASCSPGDPKILTSAHGTLDCANTKVTKSEQRVTIDWALKLDPKTLGALPRTFFVDAKGGTGSPEPRLGWTKIGTFGEGPGGDAGAVDDAAVSDAAPVGDARASRFGDDDLGGGELDCRCGVPGRANAAAKSGVLLVLAFATWFRRRDRGRPLPHDLRALPGGDPGGRRRRGP